MNNHHQYIEEIKTIFIHIPKTGGSFIERNLFQLVQKIAKNKYNAFGNHYSIAEYKLDVKFNDYKSFAVVRNPYDRLYSAFHYLKKLNTLFDGTFKKLGYPSNFKQFVDRLYLLHKDNQLLCQGVKENGQIIATSSRDFAVHLLPQYIFCVNQDETN